MTTTPKNTHEKARAFSTGFEMISRFNAATRQGLNECNGMNVKQRAEKES